MTGHNQDPFVDGAYAAIEAFTGGMTAQQQRALSERLAGRFGWQPVGEVAVAGAADFQLDRDDYDLTVVAARELGVSKKRIPTYDQIAGGMTPGTRQFLGEQVSRGDITELSLRVQLHDKAGLNSLLSRFDRKQTYPTYVDANVWDHYEYEADDEGGVMPVVVLNDTTDPVDRSRAANRYGVAGLVYTGMTAEQQRSALNDEVKILEDRDVELTELRVSDYVVLDAKRRIAGQPLLDRSTYTRFVQCEDMDIHGVSLVPRALSDGGRLKLSGSDADYVWGDVGVRRAVRVIPELEP